MTTPNRGRPLRIDPSAVSTEPGAPAFVSPPPGSPPYYGFEVLTDVDVEGFKFGVITDFEAQPEDVGDAFIVAPDDSRAGLNWSVSQETYFRQVLPPDARRWGVWDVSFPYAMTSRENVRLNVAAILPRLKQQWESWKRDFQSIDRQRKQ